VLEHGTGALNVDGARVEAEGGSPAIARRESSRRSGRTPADVADQREADGLPFGYRGAPEVYMAERAGEWIGRWPANVVLGHHADCVEFGTKRVRSDSPSVSHPKLGSPTGLVYGFKTGEGRTEERSQGYADDDGTETVADFDCHLDCAVRLLDEQSGEASYNPAGEFGRAKRDSGRIYGGGRGLTHEGQGIYGYGDRGGASRFFYTAKADRRERETGMREYLPDKGERDLNWSSGDANPGSFQAEGTNRRALNHHPTVKPVDLMQWLCRLVTPPGGVVLDPFLGSGTTGMAALREGFGFVGIERDPEYVAIARARIIGDGPLLNAASEEA
jgi:hypothetical protein